MRTEKKKLQDKIWWKNNKVKTKAYRRKWYLGHKEHNAEKSRNWHKLHPELTRFYMLRTRSKIIGMPFILTREEFKAWYLKTEKKCEYCDLVDLNLEGLLSKGRKLLSFTIDRKHSDLPYTIENICFSCWTCNRLKSDIFNYAEWKDIAQKYIKAKWMGKLSLPVAKS